jgi:hypothetical protein
MIVYLVIEFYGAFYDFSGTRATSYLASTMGTSNWRAIDVVGTSWWILVATTMDYTLAVGPGQVDDIDVVGISSWRVVDTMGTSSWRTADAMGAVWAAPATSAIASSSMRTNFSQFHATLVKYRFPISNCVQSRIIVF